ncbi:MAG TPA: LysE family translocator [Nitrobacter sp.]|nr:LysE family translocator [Nitrobacter sp.]
MLGIHDIWLFILAGLVLNVTPGPDTAYILGRSLQSGWRGGAAAALGIGGGCLVHVTGAAIGLSALLAASAALFTLVKLAGAAYLIYIGARMLLSRQSSLAIEAAGGARTMRHIFWQGALTNILNPKVALFFLAFLPQFVAADSTHKSLAFLLLGGIFVMNGTLWCLGIAAFAARAAGRIRQSGRALLWINRALGSLFVALGLRMALLEAR